MLLQRFDEASPPGWLATLGGLVSEKHDGHRCVVCFAADGSVRLMSRQGSDSMTDECPRELVRQAALLLRQLPPGWALDCELCLGRGQQASNVTTARGSRSDALMLQVFDAVPPRSDAHLWTFGDRAALLCAACKQEHENENEQDHVHVVPHRKVSTVREVMSELSAVVRAGGEGVVLRHPLGKYAHGARSPLVLKCKPVEVDDAIVVEHATTKTGLLSLVCVWIKGEGEGAIGDDGRTGAPFRVRFSASAALPLPPAVASSVRVAYLGLLDTGAPKSPKLLLGDGSPSRSPPKQKQQQSPHPPAAPMKKQRVDSMSMTLEAWASRGGYEMGVGETVVVVGSSPYDVKRCADGVYSCSCPHWRMRCAKASTRCKHITAVLR